MQNGRLWYSRQGETFAIQKFKTQFGIRFPEFALTIFDSDTKLTSF